MMVVDASALVAIAEDEPERDEFLRLMSEQDALALAPVNYLEAGAVLIARGRMGSQADLDTWLRALNVTIHDAQLSRAALAAYVRYGKGFHPAKLNLADCFAYALAKTLDAPLLFKGDDFPRTDITAAAQPT